MKSYWLQTKIVLIVLEKYYSKQYDLNLDLIN